MTFSAGTRLGAYEIGELLGKGGMGEVYRARDAKLKREVAIKVLPEQFSRDAELRFQREAEILASLNHPHVAAIYDLAEFGAARVLVLELVEGDTLADRIDRGPIPLQESLAIARQVAEALEAAHEKGIIHRDLKPANIKITPENKVKVLDFGLAKVLTGDPGVVDMSQARTVTGGGREVAILGTPAYMSPEQLRGIQSLDKRTDIWAYGCVLYEMLTGHRVIERQTMSDAIAAILEREPDWSLLPQTVPSPIRRLLQRCLEKDVKRRLHDIADARIEIDDLLREPAPSQVESRAPEQAPPVRVGPRKIRTLVGIAAAVVVLGILGMLMRWSGRSAVSSSPLARLMITLPPGQALEKSRFPPLALSPDGKLLVYAAAVEGGRPSLYLRPLDELTARAMPATEGASSPFFSPDGRWLAFYADGMLKKVAVAGGVPLTICEAPPVWSASWGDNQTIAFATTLPGSGLWLVSANGGEPVRITVPKADETQHGYPQLLTGGTQLLFSIRRENGWRLALLTLKDRQWRLLGNGRLIGEGARYLPTGHIVYAQSGGLVATPFDVATGSLEQSAVPLLEHVQTSQFGGTYFAFAAGTGTLVYVPAGTAMAERTLLRVDREGRAASLIEARAGYETPALSPDGRKLAVTISSMTGSDIWILDLERGTRVRFTAGDTSAFPVWAPGGSRLAFQSTAPGPWNLFWKPLDGTSESQPLLKVPDGAPPGSWPNPGANLLPGTLPTLSGASPQFPASWAPDGSALAFHERTANGERDIWVVSPGKDPAPFLMTPFDERSPRFSPSGRWLAYVSDEAGRTDVFVQPFPGPGPKWLVSTEGGTDPVWSRDGRELFYRRGDQVLAASVAPKEEFSPGRPRRLFELRFDTGDNGPNYDVSPDGKWFVVTRSEKAMAPGELHIVLNWFAEVTARTQAANARHVGSGGPELAALRKVAP